MSDRATVFVLLAALCLATSAHAGAGDTPGSPADSAPPPVDSASPDDAGTPIVDSASDAPVRADAPVLSRTNIDLAATTAAPELLVFKGAALLNEFVYRSILRLPGDAKASPMVAHHVVEQLAEFLGDAGFVLAKVRARVIGDQIEVQVDEGSLDKIIVVGGGWITALRFRAALNMPLDIFNRRLFEQQLPHLAKQFGFRTYRYELWPVHLLDADNASSLDDVEELRSMPLLHAARGYELRIFGQTEQWSSGFSPEIVLNGAIGIGAGGRYRWKDVVQDGDRWQLHFRVGGALRGSLDPNGSANLVNSEDYLSGRWLSKPWGGSSSGLRMTIAPHVDLWDLQRPDLNLQSYRVGTIELGVGAGSQLTQEFSLYFTLGVQRRWIFDVDAALGSPPLSTDVTDVPSVANRGFLRANSQYTFNPTELRQDLRDLVTLDLDAYQPTIAHTQGYFHFDVLAKKYLGFGWNELRLQARVTGSAGDVLYVDETPLSDSLRIGFGLEKYTKRIGTISLEFRYSLLRDKVKIGVFTDLGVWRELPRVDVNQDAELAGSSGGGIFFFLFDELQIDAFYGEGWSTDGYNAPGFALAIKEAF